MITAGFGVVLILHLGIAALAHVGLDRSAADSEFSRRLQADALAFVETDLSGVQLQRDVLLYTFNGHRSAAERVREVHRTVVEKLQLLSIDELANSQRETLSAMLESLENYQQHFYYVTQDRDRRRRLIQESFNPTVDGIRIHFGQLENDFDTDPLLIARGRQQLDLLRGSVKAYLLDPRGQSIREFDQHRLNFLATLDESLAPSSDGTQGSGLKEKARTIAQEVEELAQVFRRIVQTTRSYLHLVSVVLAGEAAEFRVLSARLKEDGIRRLESLRQRALDDQADFAFLSNVTAIATILLGILSGWFITRTISQPLRRMTDTMTALAQGEDAKIPDAERVGEIGEMARAAEVFRQRNVDTEKLLEGSRRLTSEHAAANRKLETTIQALEIRNEDLDSFAYVASHDLRAPLRAISHLVSWIQDDSNSVLPSSSRAHLEEVQQRTVRLDSLLDGLLNYSRAGREDCALEPVDVATLVEETTAMVSLPPRFEVVLTGDRPTISTTRIPLQQVLMNLINNAANHHDRDHGMISVEILDSGESALVIRIADDGPGIPERSQERVFKMFQRLDTKDSAGSTGMGLAIVKRIVSAHSGSVDLNSTDGMRGTEFVIRWPKGAADAPRDGNADVRLDGTKTPA